MTDDWYEYGEECFNRGYEEGYEDAREEFQVNPELNLGLVCHKHSIGGKSIEVWVPTIEQNIQDFYEEYERFLNEEKV